MWRDFAGFSISPLFSRAADIFRREEDWSAKFWDLAGAQDLPCEGHQDGIAPERSAEYQLHDRLPSASRLDTLLMAFPLADLDIRCRLNACAIG
jgi:hypothetical protein